MKDGTRDVSEIATLPPELVDVDIRRARRIRSVALVLLCALVLAGLAGLLGVHSATTSASANGYAMYVKYPLVARSGLDADWSVRVTVPAGTSGPVILALPKNYVQLFDLQDIVPEPAAQVSAPPYLFFTFEAPPTGTLEVFFAATKTPALSDIGVQHTEIVLLNDKSYKPVTRASYRTWVVV